MFKDPLFLTTYTLTPTQNHGSAYIEVVFVFST